MNSLSRLYQELTPTELEEASRRYLGEGLLEARLLSGGLFNTTYRLTTTNRDAILRLGPVNRHLLLPYEHHLMEAEAGILELLHRHGIPTSRMIALDVRREFLDRDVMVVECLPAVSMSTVSLAKEQEVRICREVGAFARELHRITADELPRKFDKPFGRYAAVLGGYGGATWSEALIQELHLWMSKARPTALFTPEEFDRIDRCFCRFRPLFDQIRQPRLAHADLWQGNVLVDAHGQLSAIIDTDRAFFGDPEYDLAMDWLPKDSFLEGYGTIPDPGRDAVLRRKLYKFLLDLEDCYIYIIQYSNPKASQDLKEKILTQLAELESI